MPDYPREIPLRPWPPIPGEWTMPPGRTHNERRERLRDLPEGTQFRTTNSAARGTVGSPGNSDTGALIPDEGNEILVYEYPAGFMKELLPDPCSIQSASEVKVSPQSNETTKESTMQKNLYTVSVTRQVFNETKKIWDHVVILTPFQVEGHGEPGVRAAVIAKMAADPALNKELQNPENLAINVGTPPIIFRETGLGGN